MHVYEFDTAYALPDSSSVIGLLLDSRMWACSSFLRLPPGEAELGVVEPFAAECALHPCEPLFHRLEHPDFVGSRY